ncbi:uncharacterized protein LOC121975047 isoform X1 [Zingiber officinale]|uniref:uncharacterized protein LOC121975047 isoform X1 n=1 Tax=Zingiber officinale TaxID=94328 RepID=UPI001C4D5112|nr:uncharacterized protein LOC121975047 isoform X1 [Zingiber officinale]
MASIPHSACAFPATQLKFSSYQTHLLFFRSRSSNSLCSAQASPADQNPEQEQPPPEAVKLAFSKAKAYKKAKKPTPTVESDLSPRLSDTELADEAAAESPPEIPTAVKLAMERAKKYKKNKAGATMESDQKKMKLPDSRKGIEEKSTSKKSNLKVSRIDFLGLDFAEKKAYRGMPPGLTPTVEPLVDGDFPEVELIVGDPSKFETARPLETVNQEKNDDNTVCYKPKVSTWGVFPRPNNISKTFGGGRNIQPGEMLETSENKVAKQKHTQELLAAYKSKMGLTIDYKKRVECEKALMEGNRFMDLGRLREALPFYEKIMKNLVFQSELHGQAALQWSICQDSLSRPEDARAMYERLQSHPNALVRKRAKHFAFSFQAMEVMKVSRSSAFPRETGYESYFDAFVDGKDNYIHNKDEEDDSAVKEGLPYILFLLSPIVFIFFLAARKAFGF